MQKSNASSQNTPNADHDIPGKDTSLWVGTTKQTNYPSLTEDITCDVAVVGGGMTGLLTAWFLRAEGLNAVVVEKRRLVEWTTGHTTAKLTSQHYLLYQYLTGKQGADVAKAYAKANEDGIDKIDELANKLGIDCDFARRDAYVYTNDDAIVDEIQAEVKAAQNIGLSASFETATDLPFDVKAAVKFSNQAQFHPRKFLLGIAEDLSKNKVPIYEKTEATNIEPGPTNTVISKGGNIKAKHVVVASQYPFWRADMFDEEVMWTKLSYVLGVVLKKGSPYPQGMYITRDEPTRTIRSHPYKNGELLIFGGESHKKEGEYDADEHYKNLLDDVQRKFDVEEVVYRWYAGDAMPYDRMPYIGEYPDAPTIYTATGYRAWGLAWATAAAQIITNKILGRRVDWAEPFGLGRLSPK